MGNVTLRMSMSLDGFIAGPNVGVEHPMGEGGDRLHQWMFATPVDPVDAEIVKESFASTGAVVLGRRTFDLGVSHWGDTPFPVPSFVLTHEARADLPMKSAAFTFITEGVESALRQAKAVAGDRKILLMGANTAQQFLKAGLVDEIDLQIAPVLLGGGTRLFDQPLSNHVELERIRVIESPDVTHLTFQVKR
jgi:dihydrofolate reductase